jgi:sugar phosphate isomerase/epimerase
MQLGLFTDSVSDMSFERALDFAVEIGVEAIEIATGGQSPAPHARLEQLLADDRAREGFQRAFDERGLRLEALNCSAWPLHPRKDAAHQTLIRNTITLASLLGLRKLVTMSGCPGDGPDDSFVNWVWYPWPEEAVALRERQWDAAVELWSSLAEAATSAGVEQIALELHPLHLVYNVPTLQQLREAVGPVIGANVEPHVLAADGPRGGGLRPWRRPLPRPPQGLRRCARPGGAHRRARRPLVRKPARSRVGLSDDWSGARPRLLEPLSRRLGRCRLRRQPLDRERGRRTAVRSGRLGGGEFIRPLLTEAAHAVSS